MHRAWFIIGCLIGSLPGFVRGDGEQQDPKSEPAGSEILLELASAPVVLTEAALSATAAAGEQLQTVFERDILAHRRFVSRDYLEPSGLTLGISTTQIYQQNMRNGVSTHRGKGRFTGSYDLELAGDLEKLLKLSDAGFYLTGEGSYRDGITETMVGSYFGVNGDAGGNRSLDVSEFWYEQGFFDGKLRLRLGKLDLTGGFECRGCPVSFDGSAYANDETAQFLNDALINNPTIPFTDPGLGFVIHFNPVEWGYASFGVADAQADVRETGFSTAFHEEDYFLYIFETGVTPQFSTANGPLQGAYRAGVWFDPQDKERASGSVKRDDAGLYLSFDQAVFKENAGEDDAQGLGVFARYGFAHSDISEVSNFWSVGIQYRGLFPKRDDDVIAFGAAQGIFSNAFSESLRNDSETILEMYYNAVLFATETHDIRITPSIQHVMNPGSDPQTHDATILAVRVQMSF